MHSLKSIVFCGASLDALRQFPEMARRRIGYQLEVVQRGLEPNDWKPMASVGLGVRELRVRDDRGIYRVLYVTRFQATLYVLHCFQKKTQKTSSADLELAKRRYKECEEEQRT